ncbi:MAG TPA: class I SAM-dependent methyltransferase [Anaerolineales bacterium]|nr:class I SAM-dependent methyltransferase [Anaerolineales bacterium]
METIRGRKSLELDLNEWNARLANYNHILLDLGTGDGRYARTLAEKHPGWFIIGVDACRENLREHSQAKLQNLLFVIARAQELPCELDGLVSHITINFPWGSLLKGLLAGDSKLMRGLQSISRAGASLDLRLNGGALVEAGKTLESGTDKIYYNLLQADWQVDHPVMMDASALKRFPSTWAKRLAFGRDPRATMISGQK